MRYWVQYMGVNWCGEVADAEQALEHSSQAVLYVLHGKNDCLRSAAQVSFGLLCDCCTMAWEQLEKQAALCQVSRTG